MTAATDFISRGMSAEQASEVATQIDETAASTVGFPDVSRMMGLGIPAPLANELSAQMSSGTGIYTNLMGLGVPSILAENIDAAIDAANA